MNPTGWSVTPETQPGNCSSAIGSQPDPMLFPVADWFNRDKPSVVLPGCVPCVPVGELHAERAIRATVGDRRVEEPQFIPDSKGPGGRPKWQ